MDRKHGALLNGGVVYSRYSTVSDGAAEGGGYQHSKIFENRNT